MVLRQINFHNFRNFEKGTFIINPFLTIVIGENARGKTNLLEGIHVLLLGEGFRESKEEELIHIEKEQGYIDGVCESNKEKFTYRAVIEKKPNGIEKHFFVNKTKQKFIQYVQEQTKSILFTPEQISIIIGSPSIRRNYFDDQISYYNYEYRKKLDNYTNALKRRNKVLEIHHNEEQLKEELRFWNDYLMQQAVYITKLRQDYCQYLNQHKKLDAKEFFTEYLPSEFSRENLEKVFQEEKRMRRTLIGPQKDDYQIYMKASFKKNIHHYGSRSEQRMAVLWLKMNEIHYHEETKNKKPILLLDDVFSELDIHNKKIVLELIKKYQTVITTTEKEIISIAQVPSTIIQL